MTRTALPQQAKALAFASHRHRVAFFLEMRLGKTYVGCKWVAAHEAFPALVIAPLSVLRTWVDEAHAAGMQCVLLRGTTDELDDLLMIDRPLFITSYETAVRHWKKIATLGWEAILLDESVRIKDPKTQTSKTILRHYRHAPYRAILSGRPTPEDKTDIFNQMLFLCDRDWMGCKNFWEWRSRYYERASAFRVADGWVPLPLTEEKIEHEVDKLAIRITQAEAGFKIKKKEAKLYTPLPGEARQQYKDILRNWKVEDQETKYTPVITTWLRQLCSGVLLACPHRAKLALLDEAIREYAEGKQFLVWCVYDAEVDAVERWLKARKITCTVIDGRVKPNDRHTRRLGFQRKEYRAAILKPICVKYGLDFSSADVAFWFARPWSGDANGQAEERMTHPLKGTTIFNIDLVMEDTLEEEVQAMVGIKTLTSRAFMSRMIDKLKKEVHKWR